MTFQFDSLANFMTMNGHGPFVWASYAITAAVLVFLLVSPLLQRREILRQQAKQQRIAKQ